jgi:hypothetical protein
MTPRVGGTLLIGSLIFLVVTFFEQLPVIGWLGAVASFAAWFWLAGEVRRGGGSVVDAAVVGGVTGLIGAVSAWLLQVGNLLGPDTPGLARFGAGLGTIGATVFLVLRPSWGIRVRGRRARPQTPVRALA